MDINRNAPAQADAEVVIDAPIELVWNLQADVQAWPSWNPDVQEVTLEGPLAPGTTFRWKTGGSRIVSELQTLASPHEIAWTGRTFGIRAVHVWRFREVEGGTHVHTEESFEGGIVRLLPGVFRRMLAKTLESAVHALRVEAERRARGEGATTGASKSPAG